MAYAAIFEHWRNVPKIIESLSVDGSSGQLIESSKVDPSSGMSLVLGVLAFVSLDTMVIWCSKELKYFFEQRNLGSHLLSDMQLCLMIMYVFLRFSFFLLYCIAYTVLLHVNLFLYEFVSHYFILFGDSGGKGGSLLETFHVLWLVFGYGERFRIIEFQPSFIRWQFWETNDLIKGCKFVFTLIRAFVLVGSTWMSACVLIVV